MVISRRAFLASAAGARLTWGQASLRFVRVSPRDRRYLELSDGTPYIPVGMNLIAPNERGEREGLLQIEGWLGRLRENGANFIRVWLSHEFWDVEHEHSGVYDEQKARRIDALLAMARRYGVRVKMTMEHFRSIGEGPQKWADKPLHHVSRGGPATSIADFFDGEKSREQFKKKIAWYAKRYGEREEIFGWELWNEINAVRGGDYMSWTEVMLAELHRSFPRNLCMQSLGSFDSVRWRETYRRLTRMAGNDVAQVHRYLDLGAELEVCRGPVDVLAADAVRELVSFGAEKPILLAESGAVEPRHTGPFKLYAEDKEGTILHDVLWAPFMAGAAGPGHIWHWDVYVERNNLWWQLGRFAVFVRGLDPPAEGFAASVREEGRLRVYRLEGRKTTLVWCRDVKNDWRAELERKEAPEVLTGLSIEDRTGREPILIYDPWAGIWSEGKRRNGRIELPEFRRSIAVRLG